VNPTYGSIQKLYAGWGQGGDLIALCEDRVLKILANKDALYNADGNSNITSTNNVLGTATPFAGNYGISKNPESFASESFRAYFTDKVRGAVIRLSMDGLTAISDHGMKDWFRDNLKLANRVIGSYDDRNDEYVLKLDYSYVPQSVNLITPGCMDPLAMNYNALANSADGSCTYAISGCTNPLAFNYNSSATVDDYSCITYRCTSGGCVGVNASATVPYGLYYSTQACSANCNTSAGFVCTAPTKGFFAKPIHKHGINSMKKEFSNLSGKLIQASLVEPSLITAVTVSWSSVAGASNGYTLRWSFNPTFLYNTTVTVTSSQHTITGVSIPIGQTLYWQVATNCNATGTISAFSSTQTIAIVSQYK
jgi:hypothetical protein